MEKQMQGSRLVLAGAALLALGAAGLWAADVPDYVPGEVLVKFRPEVSEYSITAILTTAGATQADLLGSGADPWSQTMRQWRHVVLENGVDAVEARDRLARLPEVEHAELNYVVRTQAMPKDESFSSLWGLNNTGTSGRADADIDAPEAWDFETGSDTVVVAIIDTGVDYKHPDLIGNMWRNTGEIPGNGIDDDGNGYVDDVVGYDFVNHDGDPWDDHSHGTHVAGTIGAVGNNGVGVTGVCWKTRIMALKFLGAGGSGSTSDAVSAVLYATANGAKVMNNSWGGGGYSQALFDAIRVADSAGVLFVAAAGNSGTNNDVYPFYPASYDLPNVLVVAATDSADALASFSCYGATSVDLAAPGVNIFSTTPGGQYGQKSGTSMATPHVVGAAALLLSDSPGLRAADLKGLLMSYLEQLPALAGRTVTGGRLNVYRALRRTTVGP
jgi:subtilisin family serine protease